MNSGDTWEIIHHRQNTALFYWTAHSSPEKKKNYCFPKEVKTDQEHIKNTLLS